MADHGARSRSAIERAGRLVAKRTVRAYGVATAPWRIHPDFLIIGAKRGGTTSLWRYLAEHPDVMRLFPRPEKIKGVYHFDEQYERGDRWYRSHFPLGATRERRERDGRRVIAGEASPYYLYHPLAPIRAAADVPEARILVALRDPVERAYSHWKERRSNDGDPLEFEAALDAEAERLAGEEARLLADPRAVSVAHRHWSYVDQGRYSPMLTRWFEAFGRDRVHVEISEEMYAAPQETFDRVTAHLGIAAHRLVDPSVHNAEPSPDLDPRLRSRLAEVLAPDIRATEQVLGRSLPWG